MMRRKIQSIMVATGLAVSALSVPLITATPASAATVHCKDYLKRQGYLVGPKVTKACKVAADGGAFQAWVCESRLKQIGVHRSHAERACYFAWHE
ncbi:hypothetical protein ACFW47_33960 [Streptomyces sp. NPDC058796]|uniref:hypothetical protein n=2 Tax=unclassified Streptomyces TaxID=2593676 RepID=UPI0036B1E1F7